MEALVFMSEMLAKIRQPPPSYHESPELGAVQAQVLGRRPLRCIAEERFRSETENQSQCSSILEGNVNVSGEDLMKRTNWKSLVAIGMAAVASGRLASAIYSGFAQDLEGWGVVDDGVISWSTQGLPSGSAKIEDLGVGGTYFYRAPAPYLGAKEGYWGGNLSWNLRVNFNNGWGPEFADARLVGTFGSLHWQGTAPIPNEWTVRQVFLDSRTPWRFGSLSGALATDSQIRAVLSSLTGLHLRGEYDSVSLGEFSLLDGVFLSPRYTWIRGHIDLQDFIGNPEGREVTLTFSEFDSVVGTVTTTLDANSRYVSYQNVNAHPDVTAKVSHWLAKEMPQVILVPGEFANQDFTLINGDVDGDNEIGPGDFGALSSAFGSSFGDAGYTDNADLDGDGEIGPSDFGILSANFGLAGD